MDIYWSALDLRDSTLVESAQLSAEEKQKFSEFQSETRKTEWLAVRAIFNKVFKEKVAIGYEPTGKPFLKDFPNYNISISHTKTIVAIALSENFKIGVDVEAVHPRLIKIADRFLNDSERVLMRSYNTMIEKIKFLTIVWCAKEALFKIFGSDVDYKNDLKAKQFILSDSGALVIEHTHNGTTSKYLAEFRNIDVNNILTWIKDRE